MKGNKMIDEGLYQFIYTDQIEKETKRIEFSTPDDTIFSIARVFSNFLLSVGFAQSTIDKVIVDFDEESSVGWTWYPE